MSELAELVDDVRRRCRASDREEARAVAELPDQDLLWLVANGWQPPSAAPARRSAGRGEFVLTVEQYGEYRAALQRAQDLKTLLELARAHDADSDQVAELRLRLHREAEEIRAMAEGWQQQ